jgi:subtilisin-like proprotein convertase family protein
MSGRVPRNRRVPTWFAACAAILAFQLFLAGGASANTFPADQMTLGAVPGESGDPLVVEFPVSGLPANPPTQVAVVLTMDHTWAGDLSAVLTAPDGTTETTLFARPNGVDESTNFDGTYTFSDRAPADPTLPQALGLLDGEEVLPSEGYRATDLAGTIQPISSEFGAIPNPNGTWTLEVSDGVPEEDSGSVTAASLELVGSVAATPGTPGAIPDSSSPGVFGIHHDITFDVSGLPLGAPADVSISMTATHPWMGNVDAVLVDPTNNETTVFSRTGAGNAVAPGSFSNLNGTYRFFDGAQTAQTWWAAAAAAAGGDIPSGSFRASEPGGTNPTGGTPTLLTPAFSGLADPNGIWALRVRDSTPGDTGSINGASLRLVPAADATPPVAPGLQETVPASPSTSTSPKVRGDAEVGSMVRLYANGTCTGLAQVVGTAADLSATGITFTVDPDSVTTISATAYDTSGNVSDCATGSTLTYRQDSTAPTTPLLTGTNPPSPANNASPKILGSTEDASFDNDVEVDVYRSANCSGPSISPTGTETLLEGPGIAVSVQEDASTTFSARATDPGGNPSACSAPLTYVEDSTALAPALTGTSPASPSNNARPRVLGTAEVGSNVDLYVTSGCTGTIASSGTAAQLAGSGIEIEATVNGATTISAKITDAAGNPSVCSTAISFTHDSVAPPAPTLSATDPASGSNDNAPRVKGTAEPGALVRLFTSAACGGDPVATELSAVLGGAGIPVSVADDSTTEFRATATDVAGNTSACSSPITYAEVTPEPGPAPGPGSDTQTPDTTATTAKTKVKTRKKSVKVRFVLTSTEASSSFLCSLDGEAFASCTAAPEFKLKRGTHALEAVAVDAAGNRDPTPATVTVKIKRQKRRA